ncbi:MULTISPECIES: lipocalin family protein [unclassified Frankia]|uniref:lipocalin family protein n=1 Tax=unclassified Frankia TaxID=2632575 RepID=UPI002AD4B861|nr:MULTISPECIES: lipocalin family protein [unclassified Frankia]
MRTTRVGAAVVVSALIAFSSLVPTGPANAADSPATAGAPDGLAHTTLPVLVNAAADLTAKSDRPNESWYVVAHVTAGGHRYGFFVHYLTNAMGAGSAVSITDETTSWYTRSEVKLPSRGGISGAPGVDIHTENITWTGDATQMKLQAKVPEGQIDVTFRPRGQVLYNLGTGYFPMFGEAAYPNYEYAFPSMATSGTLTLNGRAERLSGQSWLDHQWGPLPNLASPKAGAGWTWMDLNLSNGDKISLWDMRYNTEHTWGTIVSPDGTHTIAPATITPDASSVWTSPTTGARYPTRFKVTIPGQHAELHVTVTTKDQELVAAGSRYEGSATVTGTYEGRRVTGYTYVEQVGVR